MLLLIASFALWGINDIFKGFGQSVVAKVGRTEVSVEQFRQRYQQRLQEFTRQLRRPPPPELARVIQAQVLEEIVQGMLLDERTRRLGLNVPDDEIRRWIESQAAFRPTGLYSNAYFQMYLRESGQTEQRFVEDRRRIMRGHQLTQAVSSTVPVPKAIVEGANRHDNEERTVEYVLLDRARAGEIPAPTDDELAKYFEARKPNFRAPEYRKLVLLVLTPAELVRWIQVSDEDARKAYEARKARYTTPERRQVLQIVFPNADEAQAASARIKQGLSFKDLAAERKLTDKDIDLGNLTKAELTDPAIAEAAFALAEGAVSEPVQGRFGFALLQVPKIEPGSVRPFEEVAAELKNELASERVRSEIIEKHNKIEDARAAGRNLTEIAQAEALNVRVIDAVDRSGRDPEEANVPDLPQGVNVLPTAFTTDVGYEADPLQVPGGGYVWFEVAGITPARDRELAEVKAKVEARWRDDQVAERLRAKATALVDKLKAGTAFAEAATPDDLKVETASALKRGRATEVISNLAVNEIFKTPKGAPGSAEGSNPTEYIVFRVTEITVPPLDPASPEAKRIDESLSNALGQDLFAEYLALLRAEIGVTVYDDAIRRAVGGSSDQN